MYRSGITDSFPVKLHNRVKAESGLTYNLPVLRKRNIALNGVVASLEFGFGFLGSDLFPVG